MRVNFGKFKESRKQFDLSRVGNCIRIQKENGRLEPGVRVAVLLEDCGLASGRKGDVVLVRSEEYDGRFTVDWPWHEETIAVCNKDRPKILFCSTPIIGVPAESFQLLEGREIDRLFQ